MERLFMTATSPDWSLIGDDVVGVDVTVGRMLFGRSGVGYTVAAQGRWRQRETPHGGPLGTLGAPRVKAHPGSGRCGHYTYQRRGAIIAALALVVPLVVPFVASGGDVFDAVAATRGVVAHRWSRSSRTLALGFGENGSASHRLAFVGAMHLLKEKHGTEMIVTALENHEACREQACSRRQVG